MNYVVLVLEPLPADLPSAAEKVAEGLPIPADKVIKLLERAPGPVTRAVPERDARRIQAIMQAAGLVVEVREGSADGPVVDLVERERAETLTSQLPQSDVAAERVEVTGDELSGDRAAAAPDAQRSTRDRHRTPEPGQITTTPPRDPMRTTLVRNPPTLQRSGLRRRITSVVTMSALLTLFVTLLAVCVTVLPILRQEEHDRVAGVAGAMAVTVEGLAGGLPLSAPILRLELDAVQANAVATGSGLGVDHLLLLDADESPIIAWYRGRPGVAAFPPAVLQDAMQVARAALVGADTAPAPTGDWLTELGASGRDFLAMLGLAAKEPAVAAARIHRLGAVSGVIVAGGGPGALRQVGAALLVALLVGLVPVLFGVLAALSLTRGLRQSITYLLVATDRISHGDFVAPVELRRDDELGQIAGAVERMRISLSESMERLRQRR